MTRLRFLVLCALVAGLVGPGSSRALAARSKPDAGGVSRELVQFLADGKVGQAFIDAARADKSGNRQEWAKAMKHPAAYLEGHGVKLETGWSVLFSVTAASYLNRIYCFQVKHCIPIPPKGVIRCFTATECVPAASL